MAGVRPARGFRLTFPCVTLTFRGDSFGVPNTVNAFRLYTNRLKIIKTHVKGTSYRCFRSLRPQVVAERNHVGSVCLGDCAFTYSAEIPSALAIYPESGSPVEYTTVQVTESTRARGGPPAVGSCRRRGHRLEGRRGGLPAKALGNGTLGIGKLENSRACQPRLIFSSF